VIPAAGWPLAALERQSAEAESRAREDGELGREGVLRTQPTSQRHRSAGRDLDPGAGFDAAEFADFLEADDSPMQADPVFKERLRQRLWGMVRDLAAATAPPASSRIGARPRQPLPDPRPKPPR
jgi:hypothetical protein